jgi:tetratricopeptide (TPR) repeat protein
MTRVLALFVAVLTLAALLVQGAVSMGRRHGWRRLRAHMVSELQEGSLQALLRARIAGTGVALGAGSDPELAGDLAYVDALLATDYGLRARPEAEESLRRAAGAGADIARGLLALAEGDGVRAETVALTAIARYRDDPRPALLLARARVAAGDLAAAMQALEAAVVKGPNATAPQVGWAEARLDVGQPTAALPALALVLRRAPEHTRARLLQEEGALVLGRPPSEPARLAEGCRRDGAISPVIAASCAVRAATAARLRGDRAQALMQGRAAAAREHQAPRVLAQTAIVLAQLGRIDEAAQVVGRARAVSPAFLPALVWAQAAVELGRGGVPALPELAPGHVETRLLVARAALASGGPTALARTLAGLGGGGSDPDLRALASLSAKTPDPPREGNPVRAYAEGLRARIAGDTAGAAHWLGGALVGHGDACRAAGEYLVAKGLLHEPVEHELDPLRAADTGCINLALPPPAPRKRRR